jgi:hypothetical protein
MRCILILSRAIRQSKKLLAAACRPLANREAAETGDTEYFPKLVSFSGDTIHRFRASNPDIRAWGAGQCWIDEKKQG